MAVLSAPLSVLTVSGEAAEDALPVVSVSSPYYYEHPDGIPEEYRVLSDDSGNFILDISLDKKPEKDENITVYYRTVDASAVAKWGDYESVGIDEEAYVTLNKSNGYKASVVIKSTVISEGLMVIDPETQEADPKRIITRKFLFELTRVEGNAVLYEPDPDDGKDRDKSKCYCYLKAEKYQRTRENGRPDIDEYFIHADKPISTPQIHYIGSHSDNIQIQFSESWRDAVESGYCYVGVAINGSSIESWYNSDGYANLELLYTYKGRERRAIRLCLEGEMDDSTYFGWQHAYAYFDGSKDKMNRLDEFYGLPKEIQADVNDFMKDNFVGIHGFSNNEGTAYFVQMDSKRNTDAINSLVKDLKSLLDNGHAFYASTTGDYVVVPNYNMVFMKLPSNYVLADSYSYFFESQMDDNKEHRRLHNVHLAFFIREYGDPEVKVDNGVQMVTTNINEIKAGEPVRMTVRFNKPVYSADCAIEAKINGDYPITLNLVQNNIYGKDGASPASCDTLVFEGYLPEEAQNILITDFDDIKFTGSQQISSFFSSHVIKSNELEDIKGFSKELRAPAVKVDAHVSDKWIKSNQIDISVNTLGSTLSFSDTATVYYQWSNSAELPEVYNSSLSFNTADDKEKIKTIIGSGNGEMYLHIKAVSIHGKETISDMETYTYDPGDEEAVYTPFGPFKFDNEPPSLSAKNIGISGTLKERKISVPIPEDVGSGFKAAELYYISKNSTSGEGTLLQKFSANDFEGDPKKLEYAISHALVGVGVDEEGALVLERQEIEFYWILSDAIGNSTGKTTKFKLVFDSNDYLESEITSVGAYDASELEDDAQFSSNTNAIDDFSFIYDYSSNKDKNTPVHPNAGENLYYGFSFTVDHTAFGENDNGIYSVNVKYKGQEFTQYSLVEESDGVYVVWFQEEMSSGRYDIQLVRTEGDGERVSYVYSLYATNNENDATAGKIKVESGTLLTNSVYQLSAEYPYFYYKDKEGNRIQEYYNDTKQPASFSSSAKAKEYVYFKELGDIYLVQLNAAMANALNSGTTGYLMAKGETVVAQEGQYWIRYKSEAWTPTAGDSSWVYYYYGTSEELSEESFSMNLRSAINAVANRIVGYGRSVMLTDTSFFLGNAMGDKMLDEYGMPYLLEGQVHSKDETSLETKCGNVWSVQTYYSADKSIYKSTVSVGSADGEYYREYPIAGNFAISEDSRFQYMTYEEYNNKSEWKPLEINAGETFINVFTTSGIYYIREISKDGIGVYAIYIDKEAPKVTFSKKDESGNLEEIPIDGFEIHDIRVRDLYIGSIAATEYDRLSYVAVYKVSNLSLVGIYTASELDLAQVKLEDGNYYIVVADRSGNHYTVTAKVSSSDLDCKIKETEDKFIRLTCNRRNDQILRYEVYLNGELITSTYAEDQSFDGAGLYTVYIQDIYGNVFSEEYIFSRDYPEVTWKYLDADGKYHTYDGESSKSVGFIIAKTSENQYKISASVKMRFSYSENYVYEFIGTPPEYNESIGTDTTVTIEAGQSFTLKVYHRNYPECYTTYTGVVDATPPSINVTAEVDILRNGEYDLFGDWIANGSVGDVIVPNDIHYLLSEIGQRTVPNGGNISSDIIKINVSDVNELAFIEVYLDGELIERRDANSGFSQIIASRWGNYRIVAEDVLLNVSEFTFTNGVPDGMNYFVDGVEKNVELHGYLNFEVVDGKHTYTKVDYGNSEFKLDVKQNADVFMSVGVSGGETAIYGFRVADGAIYPLTYKIIQGKDDVTEIDLVVGEVILDMNAADFNTQAEYSIGKEGAYAVYASISADKVVSFKVNASENTSEVVSVSARAEFTGSHIMFVSSEISKKISQVFFHDLEGNEIAGTESGSYIRANNGFIIDETGFANERIEGLKLYYSRLNDLNSDSLGERTDIYSSDHEYTDEGFYLLVVRNLYGNEKIYKIAVSRKFGVTSSVTFGDGNKIYYSKDYSEILYSNKEAVLDIFDEGVTYSVTLDEAEYTDFVQKQEEGVTYLVFSENGLYEISLTDSYGNMITKQIHIDNSSYAMAEDLLKGYNEKALKRDEGYTNQKLSVDKEVYDREGIYYLAVRYNDELSVFYDAFAETPIATEPDSLIDIIGANGDGTYTVIIRNRYGAVQTKDIHYRSTPTLKLERTTRSQTESEVYDLNYALSLGFWSNNTLIFSTDAQTYEFKINGNVTECPKTLVFEGTGDSGSSEYDITYIDEYGFEYTLKAYLVRKDITVEIPADITGIEVDGILNTKNDVSVTFGENVYAIYTRNNGEEGIYKSGDVLKKDGVYRFTVMDYAGNATMLTIVKDTIVDFAVIESNKGTTVQNGGVVNSSKVQLEILNKDSVVIEKVLRDGVIQTDFEGFKFTEDGKWELILTDMLGNKAYFCFYLIIDEQNGFKYTTPYEYHITEMWYDNGDGVKVSYMSFVNHTEFTSSFDLKDNGKYTVVMISDITGMTSTFGFEVNTNAPAVSLVGCNVGETTINDITITGYRIGDIIKVYRATDNGEELVAEVEVMSESTKIPTINEKGKYRIVVESEAGVATELSFVRKHVMNTAGSIFIIVVISICIVGLFTGLVYRNKSKTDD